MTTSPIIRRIQKLLRLAAPESGATEGERRNAEAAAQNLMLKHNLREYQIHAQDEDAPALSAHSDQTEFKRSSFWIGDLMGMIGSVHYVFVVRGGNNNLRRYTMIGTEDNIAFIRTLADHLVPWLKQECKIGILNDNPKNPNAYRRAFYRHASQEIRRRLIERRDQILTSSSTDLVIHYDALNKKKAKELFPHLRPARSSSQLKDWQGAMGGISAGQRADLSPYKLKE